METKQIDNLFAYIYKNGGNPIRMANQMLPDKAFNCESIGREWQTSINKDCWWASGYNGAETGNASERVIIKKLLTFGGFEVCMPFVEEDAKKILERGQLWYGDKCIMMKGEPSHCHSNAAYLWQANKDRALDGPYRQQVAIATGYALSKDGMWRQHSWVMLRKSRSVQVVETTARRIAYFGFVLTEDEAEEFLSNQV